MKTPLLKNRLRLSIVSADFWESIRVLTAHKIPVYSILVTDSLSGEITVPSNSYLSVSSLLERRGDRLTLVEEQGLKVNLKRIQRRPVLLGGIILLVIIFLYLPSRILHIEVIGNQRIPSKQILNAAESVGIHMWAPRRYIRSEKAKNELLSSIPELEWAGVNTYGCKAVITVQERVNKADISNKAITISSIVAARDGIIKSVTVQNGTLICQVGQAVKAGQLLISGYTDCGICLRACPAEGEVYAQTSRLLNIVASDSVTQSQSGIAKKKYSLIFGKKRVNLSKGSGISDTCCGRIYKDYVFTMPGGYQLPVSLLCETDVYYDNVEEIPASERLESSMAAYADIYLSKQMIAGTIQNANYSPSNISGQYQLQCRYQCIEMIGREHSEIGVTNE